MTTKYEIHRDLRSISVLAVTGVLYSLGPALLIARTLTPYVVPFIRLGIILIVAGALIVITGSVGSVPSM